MTGSIRGTTGAAPLPPPDLSARTLPIREIAAGDPLYRVHWSSLDPIFFGPGHDQGPTYRFDSISGRFGVLYAAPHPDAALVETLLRQPQRLSLDYEEIRGRSLSTLCANRALRLVAALGENLSRLGTTAALATGPYDPCGAWSDALFNHPDIPDGILYASRHNPEEQCVALFERPDILLTIELTAPLLSMRTAVGALLDRHGKSLLGVP
jgi:hypothetical protein